MNVQGQPYRSLWWDDAGAAVRIVDQTALPHEFRIASLTSVEDVCHAIREMRVRGAPLIGAAAAYGLALALADDPSEASEARAESALLATRPTAVNLRWALRRVREEIRTAPLSEKAARALRSAARRGGGQAQQIPLSVRLFVRSAWAHTYYEQQKERGRVELGRGDIRKQTLDYLTQISVPIDSGSYSNLLMF